MAIAGAVSLSFAPGEQKRPMICSRALAGLGGSLGRVYPLVPDCAQPKERPGVLGRR
jgi:hypothetical protein